MCRLTLPLVTSLKHYPEHPDSTARLRTAVDLATASWQEADHDRPRKKPCPWRDERDEADVRGCCWNESGCHRFDRIGGGGRGDSDGILIASLPTLPSDEAHARPIGRLGRARPTR